MDALDTPADLIQVFNLETTERYQHLIPFVDGTAAFSVTREYEATPIFSPEVTRDGRPDQVALLRVIARPQDCTNPRRIPVDIDASRHRLSQRDDCDHPADTDPSVTAERPGGPDMKQPWSVLSRGEFFVELPLGGIVDKSGVPTTGAEVLNQVFAYHVLPTRPVRGLGARWEAHKRHRFASAVFAGGTWWQRVLELTLRTLGRQIQRDSTRDYWRRGFGPSDLVLVDENKVKILGYPATIHAVWAAGLLWVSAGVVGAFFSGWSSALSAVSNFPLVAIGLAILSLALLDNAVPALLLWHLNRSIIRTWERYS